MSRTCRYLTRFGLLLAVLAVSGCPILGGSPQLQVSPQALVLNAEVGVGNFRITNVGGGTLTWEVSESTAWLTLSERGALKQNSDDGPISGTTQSETDTIDVVIDSDELSLGLNQAQVTISSNGGTRTLEVSTTLTGSATLSVTPTEIDLASNLDTATFTIANQGSNRLDWTASVEGGSGSWLSVLQQSGSIVAGAPNVQVGLEADRSALTSGSYTENVIIASNGGSETIAVSIDIQSLVYDPASVDFGALLGPATRFVRIQNTSATSITVALSVTESTGSGWLALSSNTVTVPGGGQQDIALTADPTDLSPALYQGELVLSAPSVDFEESVPISMEVAQFIVSPTEVDLGSVLSPTSTDITLSNIGADAVAWELSGSTLNAPWLTASPVSGSVAGNSTSTLSVTVDPTNLDPGEHEASFSVTFSGGEEEVTLFFTRPRDAELMLSKSEYAFETVREEARKSLDILHAGDIGSINWSISTAGFPDWLRLEGTLAGTLNPEQVATVNIVVDRTLAPEDGGLFLEHTFEVVGSGDFSGTLSVHVSMRTPADPRIEVDADNPNEGETEYLSINVDEDSRSFVIRNTGDAPLLWQISLEELPSWITSITPAQSTLEPGVQQTITVNVDRTDLDYTGDQHDLTIVSNDPQNPTVPFRVEIQVPKVIIIGARQGSLAFGQNLTTAILEIANLGDPDTDLNFQVTWNKDWLNVSPRTGKSVGVAGPFKNWVGVNVTIDRAQLEEGGASGKLTISAYTRENGQNVPRDDIEPVDVDVSVIAAQLSFEVAQPRTRIPSLIRYELLMRNKRYSPIPLPDARLDSVAPLFGITESDEAIEPNETDQYLTPIRYTRTTMLILLDYSGSMLVAATKAADDGQFGPNPPADPLQALYEATIPRLIDELPDYYNVALGVFNERQSGGLRLIAPADGEPTFTRDKDVLKARVEGINVVDHGATELLPAFEQAALVLDDYDEDLIAFDNSGQRLLLCVSDGRLTTPPGDVTQTTDVLYDRRVRLFSIGWGEDVVADPLIRIGTATGGHYYATQNRDTGDRDPFGTPIRVPVVDEILAWCVSDPLADIAEELDAALLDLDQDGNQLLNLGEALAYVPAVSQDEFDSLDTDGSGLLSLEEARGKYRHLSETRFGDLNQNPDAGLDLSEAQGILPPLTADEFAETLDLDLDGQLTPEELAAAVSCDQSIPRDLKSQVVFSYVTLTEDSSVTVEAELAFDDPNDQSSPCLDEQGTITGSFSHSLLDFGAIVGDPRLGQIGLEARGRDDDGSPIVVVRAEYIPRNITQLAFQITSAQPFTVSQVPPLSGGIIHDWNESVSDVNSVYTYTSPEGEALGFATFGDLLEIRFDPSAPASFDLDFDVAQPVFDPGTPDGKYFTHPDRITVTDEGFHATAFPRPWLESTPDLLGTRDDPYIDLGSGASEARIDVFNLGGSHEETEVELYWELVTGTGAATFRDENGIAEVDLPDGIFGFISSSRTSDFFTVEPDRTNNLPGTYSVDFYVGYIFGSLGLVSQSPIVTVYYDVLDPVLSVSEDALAFGSDLVELPITITNDGQSLLNWEMNSAVFPIWFGVTQDTGSLGPGENDTFNVRVFRDGVAEGDYTFDLVVSDPASGQSDTVTVTMTVPAP